MLVHLFQMVKGINLQGNGVAVWINAGGQGGDADKQVMGVKALSAAMAEIRAGLLALQWPLMNFCYLWWSAAMVEVKALSFVMYVQPSSM